ncbi:RCC1/BLIP-II [Gloeopeniophorella convolvens]|nr:RCC1/BLIP-II [Gloeopeniophorella convolvens]
MQLSDLPVEVLLDNLLPAASPRDVLSLGSANKFFAAVCADDTFWKRKCEADFNFTSQETARQTGWKKLYRGLSHPRVYVWGERRNGRLGVSSLPKDTGEGVPYPIEVKFPGSRIVSLVAGGMSFHALDSQGSMYVWGTLNGESMALNSEGFSMKYKEASVPHKLLMPNPIRTVSCGRMHTMALDSNAQIWTFVNWGRPFRLDSPMLDCHSPDTTPLQAESGWSFCSILTQSGDVLVFWPFSGQIGSIHAEQEDEMNQRGDSHANATSDRRIPCVTWPLRADPTRLPPIPRLPELKNVELSDNETAPETMLIKIAAFDNHLIGLTNKGHVLKFGDLSNETSLSVSGRWQYLANFSEVAKVAAHPAFEYAGNNLEAPTALKITHITAHYEAFVAYSTGENSVILMGDVGTHSDSTPKIVSELQNRGIISIVLGDYHNGALTIDGQLLTWGQYSHGALGLGVPTEIPVGAPGGYATEDQLVRARASNWGPPEPPSVAAPAPVNFNHGRNVGGRKFCFAATAAGWHTGALVIDLEPEKEDQGATASGEDSGAESSRSMRGRFSPSDRNELPESVGEPSLPSDAGTFGLGRIFRIGFAGRGRGYGRGRGQ